MGDGDNISCFRPIIVCVFMFPAAKGRALPRAKRTLLNVLLRGRVLKAVAVKDPRGGVGRVRGEDETSWECEKY